MLHLESDHEEVGDKSSFWAVVQNELPTMFQNVKVMRIKENEGCSRWKRLERHNYRSYFGSFVVNNDRATDKRNLDGSLG